MSGPSQDSLEATHVDPYLRSLFVVLAAVILVDGFDSAMLTLASPDICQGLGISRGEWGTIFAVTRLGMVASFFLLLFADRWGRRTLLALTVVGFCVFNVFTAFSRGPVDFTSYQFVARIFFTAGFALAVIIIAEEYPARMRGRATAILTSLGPIGIMVVAKVQPYVLLEVGAEGNWLHDSVGRTLLAISGVLGLGTPLEDWRVLFLLGGTPVLLVFLVWFGVRETRRFSAERSTQESPHHRFVQEIRAHLQNARTPWQKPYRARMIIVVVLWNCVHLVTAPAVAFWVIYAKEDLLLTPHQVGQILFLGYAGGFVGSFLAGFLIDWIGRKRICAVFYVLASVAIFMLFQTRTLSEQYLWMILTVFVFGVANSATNIYSSELFPTAIRATGYAWATMVFGRATEILTPLGIGLFVGALGISWSVAVFAFGPIIGAIIVLLYAPETKGLTLEEIQEKLATPQGQTVQPSDKGSSARTAAP